MSRTPSASPSPHALLRAATKEAYERVTVLLNASYADFSPEQQQRIRALVAGDAAASPARRAKPAKTARGRDRTRFPGCAAASNAGAAARVPQTFLAWEGTVAHTEWKKHHPDERFPAYPG